MSEITHVQMTKTGYKQKLDEELEKQQEIERIEQIEKDLIGLSELMSSFRELVHEQQPDIDEVEKNIETSAIYTEDGLDELETAELHQRNARMKKIKVMSGALVGGLLFGGVGVAAFGASQALIAVGVGTSAGAFTGFLA
jgi:DNA repair exonuclease SbcCD ATPase subunit